jgi:hypothetical protein
VWNRALLRCIPHNNLTEFHSVEDETLQASLWRKDPSLPFVLKRVRLRLSDRLATLIPDPSPAERAKGANAR